MADKILSSVVEKNASDVVIRYHVAYEVEHETAKNNFCVVVNAHEMIDPDNDIEAITKANVIAKTFKDAWVTSLPQTTNEVLISEAQDVIL